jgi:hypothetical protein
MDPAMARPAILLLLATAAFGQLQPTNPHPTNVDFSEGQIGEFPPGWNMPQAVLDAGYRVQLRRQDCKERFSSCVIYLAPPQIGGVRAAELQQTFPAAPFLGKTIHFSAWLRVQGADRGNVELRMRVDHVGGRVEFFDSIDGPVHAEDWQRREVVGQVASDAFSISIWARYHPPGFAWVSDPLLLVK